jgi:hypothetical protein
MKGNFSSIVLFHASFVALTYAMLAYGASVYRRIVDNLAERTVQLGEDIHFGYDPFVLYALGVLSLLDIAFVYFVVYILPEAEVQYYVIPLALTINITQIAHRMHYQRLQIKTKGLVGKNIFAEDFQLIPYEELYLVEVERDSLWNAVTFYIAHAPTNEQKPATDRFDQEPEKNLQTESDTTYTPDNAMLTRRADYQPRLDTKEELHTFRRRMSAQILDYTLEAVRSRSQARIIEIGQNIMP